MSDSLRPHGLNSLPGSSVQSSLGKNTGVGWHFFLQGIFLTQELNPCLLHWQRRQWHPTPVLLPGKSRGQRSLVGCSPWGRGISGSRGEAGCWSLVCTSQSTAVSCLDISFSLQQPCLLQTAGRRCPCASPPMGAVGGSHFPERVNKNSLRFLKNKYTLPLQQAELVCLSHAYFSRKTGHARFANKS